MKYTRHPPIKAREVLCYEAREVVYYKASLKDINKNLIFNEQKRAESGIKNCIPLSRAQV